MTAPDLNDDIEQLHGMVAALRETVTLLCKALPAKDLAKIREMIGNDRRPQSAAMEDGYHSVVSRILSETR